MNLRVTNGIMDAHKNFGDCLVSSSILWTRHALLSVVGMQMLNVTPAVKGGVALQVPGAIRGNGNIDTQSSWYELEDP